ncbi:MAG: hypothetical protein AVDCRST_MAG88-2431, partial [uncultured Thermomicrobiales bacterium]
GRPSWGRSPAATPAASASRSTTRCGRTAWSWRRTSRHSRDNRCDS